MVSTIGGSAIAADITEPEAPAQVCDALSARHGGVDVVVHNAGITRDKTLGGMDSERWDLLMDVNLTSEERLNDALLERELLKEGGRIVCVSSLSGIAGNAGQTNYSTSKAGVIGMVQSMAPILAERGATINAVAPGFIETQMTAACRRPRCPPALSSLSQEPAGDFAGRSAVRRPDSPPNARRPVCVKPDRRLRRERGPPLDGPPGLRRSTSRRARRAAGREPAALRRRRRDRAAGPRARARGRRGRPRPPRRLLPGLRLHPPRDAAGDLPARARLPAADAADGRQGLSLLAARSSIHTRSPSSPVARVSGSADRPRAGLWPHPTGRAFSLSPKRRRSELVWEETGTIRAVFRVTPTHSRPAAAPVPDDARRHRWEPSTIRPRLCRVLRDRTRSQHSLSPGFGFPPRRSRMWIARACPARGRIAEAFRTNVALASPLLRAIGFALDRGAVGVRCPCGPPRGDRAPGVILGPSPVTGYLS